MVAVIKRAMSREPTLMIPEVDDDYHQELAPEFRLLVAILSRALLDLRGIDTTAPHIVRESSAWIRSRRKTAWSFEWLCWHLDIQPDAVRRVAHELQHHTGGVKYFNYNKQGGLTDTDLAARLNLELSRVRTKNVEFPAWGKRIKN